MPHFFLPPGQIQGKRFWLAPEESDHLARVLRKRPGDKVSLFDGKNRSWQAVLRTVGPGRIEGELLSENASVPPAYRLTLMQALPKNEKWEWILEKGCELGVAAFIPLLTERSVPRVPPDRLNAKLERWRRVVRAASEQCGRVSVPEVGPPRDFAAALSHLDPGEATFFLWEGESARLFRTALQKVPRQGAPGINVIIGPEGGWTPDEVEKARAAGVRTVSAGPQILRTETAGLFAAASILYELAHNPND